MYQKFRLNYLVEYWEKEVIEYKADLKASKKKQFLALAEKLDGIDKNFVKKFLKLYLN